MTTWITSVYDAGPLAPRYVKWHDGVDNRTFRNAVTATIGGESVRVRLTNRYGTTPVSFDAATLAFLDSGPALVSGSLRTLTFQGSARITIPAGENAVSDAVDLSIHAGQRLAVSLYAKTATGPVTAHATALRTSWLSQEGDFAAAESGASFVESATTWYFVDGVDVLTERNAVAVASIGDSITEGYGTTVDADRRWTDVLARALAPQGNVAILNAGINGNLLLTDSACFGGAAATRWQEEIAGRAGVGALILMSGVGDLIQPELEESGPEAQCLARNRATPADMIAGFERIAEGAHAQGLRVYVATLPPFAGFSGWSAELEQKRLIVNERIRRNATFDGVVDIATALGDPAEAANLAPDYDSGDGLHPNDAGAAAIANAIDLSWFGEEAAHD